MGWWQLFEAVATDPNNRLFMDCNYYAHNYGQLAESFLYNDSDTELGWELAERRKTRRESSVPMNQGLQAWVDLKATAGSSSSSSPSNKDDGDQNKQLAVVSALPITRKKKAAYEEIKEQLTAGKVKEAKINVRDSDWELNEEIRSRLWPHLSSIHEATRTSLDGLYWDSVSQIYGSQELPSGNLHLPPFTDTHYHLYYGLSAEGRKFTDRIVSVVGYAYPEITYCPLLLPLTSLFLHYVQEEKTYNSMCTLLSAKHKVFLTQTKLQWEVTYTTAMNLTKKFSKPAFTFIQRNLQPGERIESVFQGWIWWIFRDLPLSHTVRIIDCFLMEGVKVLYRVALALLLSFTKACGSDSKWSNLVESSGLEIGISKFCSDIATIFTPQRLLKSAFSIRAFRGAEIRKISTKVELVLKSRGPGAGGGGVGGGGGGNKMQKSKSNENLPSSQSQMDIQMMSHTLAIKEGKSSPEHRSPSMGSYPLNNINSVASRESLLALWQWLPIRITMYQPVLLYTTEEHGCSLTTFFKRVENHEPTILIIKTTTDEVFGAYCSSHWGARNEKDEKGDRQRYFGTGETFLFSLWPERKKYPWVGIKPIPVDEDIENEDPSLQNNAKRKGRGEELFMHADTHMISIGGGEGQGICLDEDLRFGKSETCSTFQNPPLAVEKDFEVSVLEVIGFSC
ncbi:GTPase-activating protein skywalker isoform X3 [Folsomia candida]|uniref:GTPase-activating protein skywalker isoform X3 n=1 Tax=Folsomia candida TaxID=158441 RepID=UPI0016055E1A|nr:GTPase-activating protein skywalker isoform X3 [Folsomia candida]